MEQVILNGVIFVVGIVFGVGAFYGMTNGKFNEQHRFNEILTKRLDRMEEKIDELTKNFSEVLERISKIEGKLNDKIH